MLAPLVVTLKDGTVLHLERNGKVLKAFGPSSTRFLGGPGSGNFGHAGRPGEIGGSSSGDENAPLEQIQKCTEHECFANTTNLARERGDDAVVVHGTVLSNEGKRIDHAWVEEGSQVFDPTAGISTSKARYYKEVQAQPTRRYSNEQVAINLLRTRHQGPWTSEEVGSRHLGGPGSGNFGHAGRPGEIGGSAPAEGSSSMPPWKSPGGLHHTGIEWKQDTDPKTGRPIPIHVDNVEEGVQLILQGKVIEVDTPQAAVTLIDRLGQMALNAKVAGAEAPNYDLCQISVKGTNLFCAETVRNAEFPEGIPRLQMPQLGGEPVPGSEADKLPRTPWNPKEVDGAANFKAYLAGIGMRTTEEVLPASHLKASQREMKGLSVGDMMRAYDDGTFDPAKNPVFVSSDNYVVDGHHRWAAVMGIDARDGRLGDRPMPIIRVNAPIAEVLHIANLWSERFGIKQNAGVLAQSAKVRAKSFER